MKCLYCKHRIIGREKYERTRSGQMRKKRGALHFFCAGIMCANATDVLNLAAAVAAVPEYVSKWKRAAIARAAQAAMSTLSNV